MVFMKLKLLFTKTLLHILKVEVKVNVIESIGSTEFKNEQYEKSLLGIVLSNNTYADKDNSYLLEEDFFVYENKLLFKLYHIYTTIISQDNDQILNHATRENQ